MKLLHSKSSRMILKFLILIVIIFASTNSQSRPTICLPGDICYEGAWIMYSENSKFASFQEIRYALPPTGNYRFQSPQKYFPEKGTSYDVGSKSKVVCPQISNQESDGSPIIEGEEDCLFLNVYVPKIAMDNINEIQLPVMIFIHGGSLIVGSGNYDSYGPLFFMEKEEVILVTINYRLGPLGFIFMNSTAPGNAGLKDQVMALHWVQDNIAQFGGDPDRVTIFGQSSGSFSASVHMLSPLSTNLFQRAIMQSESALGFSSQPGSEILTPNQGLYCSNMLSEKVNCGGGENINSILLCLQGKSMEEIIEHENVLNLNTSTCWMAVQDDLYTDEPFLVDDPEYLLSNGQINKADVIYGTTAEDGMIFWLDNIDNPELWEDFKNNFDIQGPMKIFGINSPSEITDLDVQNAHKVIDFYVGGVENIDEGHRQGLFDLMTDSYFLYGTYRTINYLVTHGITVFQYILTYQGRYSFTNAFDLPTIGVCHADDLLYLFDPLGTISKTTDYNSFSNK